MSQCLNPDCLQKNRDGTEFCQKCGSKLLLREHYRALKKIGEGGFGRTFLAIDEDKPSKPYCVIKQFLPQAQGTDTVQKASELFEQEAVRLDYLGRKHDQVPELFAYFTQDNRQYLVQEYIDGQNLAQELEENGVFNEQQIRTLLIDLLRVLHFIHENKVIHRDIKPENIIRRKSDGKLILVDFGASKLVTTTTRSVTGTVIGSAEYVAPEQAMGKTKSASDLYSLGVTCVHLLTRISPFDLFDVGDQEWVWRQYLVNNPVSDELGQILDKLIKTATKKRFQTASEVLQAINPEPNLNKNFTKTANCQTIKLSQKSKKNKPLKLTREQFIEAIDNGSRDLNGLDLQGLDLSNLVLDSVNLSEANLSQAKLTGVRATNIVFNNANLQGTNFTSADLRGATLLEANLQQAILTSVSAVDAIFINANLQGTNFTRADLRGAKLKGAKLQGANFTLADLKDATFEADKRGYSGEPIELAELKGANFQQANLRMGGNLKGPLLQNLNLQEVNLEGANLINTDLRETNLQGVNLQKANLRGANLSQANLKGADLGGADLGGADLGGANLSQANLKGATLRRAKYNDLTQWPDNFIPLVAGAIMY